METFNPDPKPGRIVLPLVLIGMIATTYTFINRVATNNNLEIIAEETPIETVSDETIVEDTSTTTTTTTLPDNYVAYLEEITAEKIQATELGKEVLEANENWDTKSVTYQEAKDEFRAFIETAANFVTTVSEPIRPENVGNSDARTTFVPSYTLLPLSPRTLLVILYPLSLIHI